MKSISKNMKSREQIMKYRSESITTSDFVEYSTQDGFHSVCESLFLNSKPIEYPFNILIEHQPSDNFVHYQIPYEKRGGGLEPLSFKMSFDGYSIFDDGYGNLMEDGDLSETIIGNIFYNSGNIFLYDRLLSDNTKSLLTVDSDVVSLKYKREVFFIHNKIYLEIDSGEYNNTRNKTFQESQAKTPFITCVYLYNEDDELIAKAQLSKPVSTSVDLFLILDDLETI